MELVNQILYWEYQVGPIHLIGWHLYFLIALFSLLAWVLKLFLFDPLLDVMAEREAKIHKGERAERESQREYLEKMHAYDRGIQDARRQAYSVREDAQREASREGEARLEEARGQAQERIQESLSSLDAQVRESRGRMQKDAEELARAIAARILGGRGAEG